ncbi:MAG: hypothetical protein OSB41_14030 [Kiritimatiellae bacterium]|nr:hypothetical protein [Kiritimatiellia bacterium]
MTTDRLALQLAVVGNEENDVLFRHGGGMQPNKKSEKDGVFLEFHSRPIAL